MIFYVALKAKHFLPNFAQNFNKIYISLILFENDLQIMNGYDLINLLLPSLNKMLCPHCTCHTKVFSKPNIAMKNYISLFSKLVKFGLIEFKPETIKINFV